MFSFLQILREALSDDVTNKRKRMKGITSAASASTTGIVGTPCSSAAGIDAAGAPYSSAAGIYAAGTPCSIATSLEIDNTPCLRSSTSAAGNSGATQPAMPSSQSRSCNKCEEQKGLTEEK